MIAFYATSFDAIAMVAASYSYRELPSGEEPHLGMRVFWSIVLILLPIALVFSESSIASARTVAKSRFIESVPPCNIDFSISKRCRFGYGVSPLPRR